ncbi:MAG TPA: DUF47 family protein [Bacteroidales bacterium]|nr:DUF47 family protein [Bacteroidales bacterium]
MKIDKFLKFFVPKDQSFFPLFESDAKNLVKATELLQELMATNYRAEHERIFKEIKAVEHDGDIITKKAYVQLNRSFITPFDREDIHHLTAHIDEVVDTINGIARRIYLYKPARLMPVYSELAVIINSAAIEIEKAVASLPDAVNKKKMIFEVCDKISVYEHEADELYFSGVSEAFEKENDSKQLIITSKILELLERCVDEEEDVTDTMKAILIKMA